MAPIPPGPAFPDPFATEPVIGSEQALTEHLARLVEEHWQAQRRVGAPAPARDPDAVALGSLVRGWRRQQGLGRLALAQRAGLHPLYLVALETGLLVRGDDTAHDAREVHSLSIEIVSTMPMIAASTGESLVRVVMRADEPVTTRTVSLAPALTVSTATTGTPVSLPPGSRG